MRPDGRSLQSPLTINRILSPRRPSVTVLAYLEFHGVSGRPSRHSPKLPGAAPGKFGGKIYNYHLFIKLVWPFPSHVSPKMSGGTALSPLHA